MPPGAPFEHVLAAAQIGEEWALSALYRDVHPGLLRYLSAQEPSEAEDLASEVWIDAASGLTHFEGDQTAFRCWLFTIAHRRLIDLRRRRARRRTDPVPLERLLDCLDPTEAFSAVEGGPGLACLAALPPEQAEIVLLRVVGGLDANQVAAVTGRRPGTVRVIQKRALDRLAKLISRESTTAVTP